MKTYLDRKIVKDGTESFIKQKDLFDLEKFIIQVSSVPPISSGGDNFANADLTLTGNRLHEGLGQNIDFNNYGTWDVLTEGNYTITNSNSDFKFQNGTLSTIGGIPFIGTHSITDNENYTMSFLADGGAINIVGVERVSDLGGPLEAIDRISINDTDTAMSRLVTADALNSVECIVSLSDTEVELRRFTKVAGVSQILSFMVENDTFKFNNSVTGSYTFPKTVPSAEYEALVDDGTASGTMEFRPTIPSYIATTPVKLPGTYKTKEHYKVTITDGTFTSGDTVFIAPIGATVYNVTGFETALEYIVPYTNIGTGEYISFQQSGDDLYIITDAVNAKTIEITIYYHLV